MRIVTFRQQVVRLAPDDLDGKLYSADCELRLQDADEVVNVERINTSANVRVLISRTEWS